MDPDIQIALVGGGFAILGVIVTSLLGLFSSHLDHKRKRQDEIDAAHERERAILHGCFALCNFIAEKLNEWDTSKAVHDLSRLSIAQPYLAKLIDRSPQESERLMVSLIDLGLRLEGLLFTAGYNSFDPSDVEIARIDAAVVELSRAVELVQLLLDSDPAVLSDEDIEELIDGSIADDKPL